MKAPKLPTAEEALQEKYEERHKIMRDARIMPVKFPEAYRETAIAAIESHTEAHTAQLRDELRIETQKAKAFGHALNIATIDELNLRERVKELETLMQEFVDRVDRGEVRSKVTYAKFKEALKS